MESISKLCGYCSKNKQYILLSATLILSALLLWCGPVLQSSFSKIVNIASFLVWHNISEIASIIIAICVFCVSYYSFEQTKNFRYLFLGSVLLLMGFIDYFHTMSYPGMPDFFIRFVTTNRSTTFWIIARVIGGIGFLTASIIPVNFKFTFSKVIFFIIPVLTSLAVFILVTFFPWLIPPMYIEGKGLTEIKKLLEYFVMLLNMGTICIFLLEYKKSKDLLIAVLADALIIGIFSEMSFTFYSNTYDIYNYLGHLFKFLMYFIVFRVIFIHNIRKPYVELSSAKDEIKNYADNLDIIVEQRTEQINEIHQKLLSDLEYARDIQMAMLPKVLPNGMETAFEACYIPAERVGGDFYNVFKIDENRIGMYIGDVSGHGVSAAMLTVFLNQSIKTTKENIYGIQETLSPSEVLKNIYSSYNQTNFTDEVYIVMLYCIFDISTRVFTFSSAGLNVPPMIVNSSGGITELAISGFPICKFQEYLIGEYKDSSIKLNKGDKILFYTDGLIEAENKEKQEFTDSRLIKLLKKNYKMDARELSKNITESVSEFIKNRRLRDDITFFIMEVK